MGWSAEEIPDLSGRTAVVTGSNSGIGLVAAQELARKGARVVLAVRDADGKGAAAATGIRARVPNASVEVRRLDLADLASVRAFAEGFTEPLHLLVDNAGVMAPPRSTTKDGFELQIGTNHLGHFALTGLLLPRLLETEAPRVTIVSSGAHRMGRINFDDLQSERGYSAWRAYGQSKLANLLFMFELGRRADAAGLPLVATAAHPGYASTNLQFAGPVELSGGNPVKRMLASVGNTLFGQSAQAGALPTLYAATAPGLASGTYIGPSWPGEMRGSPVVVGCSGAARDADTARRLWAVSEELTGVRYDALDVPVAT